MATVTPTTDSPVGSATVLTWTALATGDTVVAHAVQNTKGAIGSVQATGTFGGATITLTGSNDGTNYVTLKDPSGTAISLTAAGAFEFSTAMLYIKPGISGGTGDDVDVIVAMRG